MALVAEADHVESCQTASLLSSSDAPSDEVVSSAARDGLQGMSSSSSSSSSPWLCETLDNVAAFLSTTELARASAASRLMRLELTVEARDGCKRLLCTPFVELKTETVEATLEHIHLGRVRTMRVFQQLAFQALADKVRSLGPGALRKLERLLCKGCRLDPHTVREQIAPVLVPAGSNLKMLNLERNRIDDTIVQELCATGVIGRVETLNLRFNEIRDGGAMAIANSADSLRLKWVNLKMNRVTDEGAAALASLLARSKCMTLLNLRRQMPGLTDRSAAAFAEALRVNRSLQQLRFRRNKIGNNGAAVLASAVNARLTEMCKTFPIWREVYFELDLEENQVREPGALSLLSAASEIPRRARVELLISGNRFETGEASRETLQAFAEREGNSTVDVHNGRLWFESKPESDL